jgi:hypothetical protein
MDLANGLVDVQAVSACRRFLDECPNASDDFPGAFAVSDDASARLSGLLQLWRPRAEPAQTRAGIGDDRGDRLIDFMSNRGRELPHRCDAIRVCQLHLELAVAPLAFAHF